MARYILNAFSFNMVDFTALGNTVSVQACVIDETSASALALGATSAVGHADTARVFSQVLGVDIAAQRTTVELDLGDVALVGQYKGPRLAEGATELPEGATIQWLRVEIR